MLRALTRDVSRNIGRCELTHLPRLAIDYALALEQHRRYVNCLADLGCAIQRVPAAPELPDSVFIEDTCVVVDELAVITRPGSESRRAETTAVAEALKAHRPIHFIKPPGTLDGGDVLHLGRRVFVGVSSRTNAEGIGQLGAFLSPHGYSVTAVDLGARGVSKDSLAYAAGSVGGCLHLKTAVTQVGEKTILVNRAWVDPGVFGNVTMIEVDPAEPYGANALLVNGTVVYPAEHPRTRKRLEEGGLRVRMVEVSELAKAEGAVTCCSVVFPI